MYRYGQLGASKEKTQDMKLAQLQQRNTEADFYAGAAKAATQRLMAHQGAAIDPFGGRGGGGGGDGAGLEMMAPHLQALPPSHGGGQPGGGRGGGNMPPMPAFRRGGASAYKGQ